MPCRVMMELRAQEFLSTGSHALEQFQVSEVIDSWGATVKCSGFPIGFLDGIWTCFKDLSPVLELHMGLK